MNNSFELDTLQSLYKLFLFATRRIIACRAVPLRRSRR
uniref:Uncharacterized protein n=1 Tax=Anguilla anguilla TaxID=7936 RepID=A0A0E9RHZ5_ANGAN